MFHDLNVFDFLIAMWTNTLTFLCNGGRLFGFYKLFKRVLKSEL